MKAVYCWYFVILVTIFNLPGWVYGVLTVVHTEALPDSSTRISFEDSDPPVPYSVERLDSGHGESPWRPLPWNELECIQPAKFTVQIPGTAQSAEFYRISVGYGAGTPLVIATDPANGATKVSPDLDTVSVTFNRPMAGTAGLEPDANWGASYITWTADHRTVNIHRLSASTPLPSNTSISMDLNAGGEGFADMGGKLLPACNILFTTGSAEVEGPYVTYSNPPSGAKGVNPYLDTVELRFNEPMMPVGGFINSGWWPWTLTWSSDGRTAYVQRGTAGKPQYGHSVMLIPIGFRTIDGTPMTASYTLTFITDDPPVQRIEADPNKGFYWPYYLLIPPQVTAPGTLLVEPNNTGTWGDDPWFHEDAALALLRWRGSFAVELGCPLLVPVFPRPQNPMAPEPGGIYVQALDRYSLSDEWVGLQYIDLQMEAMINDALQRLRDFGQDMDDKVFMTGFSASGAFTSRFSVLHPERLKAAAPGSPGGWPIAPVADWQGTALPYPFGLDDFQDLTGKAFNLNAFRQIGFYIYVGGADSNDALDFRGIASTDVTLIKQMLNYPADRILANRWPLAETIYSSIGANATFAVYPGIGHTITEEMFDDLLEFFNQHR